MLDSKTLLSKDRLSPSFHIQLLSLQFTISGTGLTKSHEVQGPLTFSFPTYTKIWETKLSQN